MSRPRSFDEDALLDAAVELFWVRGYRAASIAELAASTGVANGSIYHAWGTKWELFLAAYRRYCAARSSLVAGAVSGVHADAREAAATYLEAILSDCARHPDQRGCLMLNTISELGSSPEVREISASTIADMELSVASDLARSSRRGADESIVRSSAAHLVALSQAMIQQTRIGRSDAELRAIADDAAASVEQMLRAA